MLKFFRKFRRKFISERKIGNYLLYALGEIILVVIGILIALAINNSNEDRIKREKEQVYLVGLKNEFKTSKSKLEELIRVNSNSYEAAIKIMALVDSFDTASEAELSELFVTAFAYDIFFNPNNSLLNEMINSGSLKDISNDTLRIQLTHWIATIEDIANQEKVLSEQRNNVVNIFRQKNQSIRTILDLTGMSHQLGLSIKKDKFSNLSVLSSTSFENNMLLFIVTSQATENSHYRPLIVHLDSILSLIEKEIQNE